MILLKPAGVFAVVVNKFPAVLVKGPVLDLAHVSKLNMATCIF